jgi:predicted aldo/keto reductase-like oxidoreductase
MRYRSLAAGGPQVSELGFGVIIFPVRDQGWLNGRPENQEPARAS